MSDREYLDDPNRDGEADTVKLYEGGSEPPVDNEPTAEIWSVEPRS